MIILSYNIQGLGKREKRRDVCELIQRVKADICCIQESKLEQFNSRIARSIWGTPNCDWEFAASEGSSGGIVTLWNPLIFQKTSAWSVKEMLVVNGFLVEEGKGFSIINVYASQLPAMRAELWDQIRILAEQCIGEYLCVVGDFNSIRAEEERVGRGNNWDMNDIQSFNDFIANSNLLDLRLSGRSFTWYRPDGSCKSWLDRMLVNEEWIGKWPHAVLKGGRRTLSDHCPIYIEAQDKDWGPKPFRFFNHWMQHNLFKSFVETKWNSFSIHGWGGYIVKEKLKFLKGEFRVWKEEVFGNLDTSIEKKKQELEQLDILDEVFGLGEEEAEKRASIMNDQVRESSWREAQLFQKARIRWTLDGDLNSHFFHKWINYRNKSNGIDGIRVNGSWLDSVQEAKSAIFHHFSSHFDSIRIIRPKLGPDMFLRKLGEPDNSFLTAEFSEDEIKAAIWSVDSNSSPGPDGYTFGFFKQYWELIKPDILHMMRDFHANDKLVRGLNSSFISLIPKIASPQRIDDYRPISLIGGAYKIIAKVLASRLSRVINLVIADN